MGYIGLHHVPALWGITIDPLISSPLVRGMSGVGRGAIGLRLGLSFSLH